MLLKSYEEQTLKLAAQKKRLKFQLIKKEEELKLIEDHYSDQIRILNKKLYACEERIKMSNTIKLSSCRDDSLFQDISTSKKITSSHKTNHNNSNKKDKLFSKGRNKMINKSQSQSFVLNKNEEIATLSKKHEELLAKLDKCSKKIIKETSINKKKGHNRHKSMQDRIDMLTQKEILFNSNISNHYNHNQRNGSQCKLEKTTTAVLPNSFVINQIGSPFVNNINIFTTNADNNNSNNHINTNTSNNHISLKNNYTNKIYHKLNPEIYRKKANQGTLCLHHKNN